MKNQERKSNKSLTLRKYKAPLKIKENQIIGYIIKNMARSKRELFSFNDILKMTNKHYEVSVNRQPKVER